jgi:hypothetical protein
MTTQSACCQPTAVSQQPILATAISTATAETAATEVTHAGVCCGSIAEAAAAGACCDPAARREAVATGATCCG